MVSLECEYEIENKVNKNIEISSEQGLKLCIDDERGEILQIECSCQPETIITRITIKGKMFIDLGRCISSNGKNIGVIDGILVIKRV